MHQKHGSDNSAFSAHGEKQQGKDRGLNIPNNITHTGSMKDDVHDLMQVAGRPTHTNRTELPPKLNLKHK